jgi:hypothetical protein
VHDILPILNMINLEDNEMNNEKYNRRWRSPMLTLEMLEVLMSDPCFAGGSVLFWELEIRER